MSEFAEEWDRPEKVETRWTRCVCCRQRVSYTWREFFPTAGPPKILCDSCARLTHEERMTRITTDRLVQRLKDAAEKILFREGREFERRR